ncbi:hypothetical protein [Archaeoglobus veneficus]|uniref:Uncharacterized protein n=1 Tax=Archaeoglobus veneficus (strain DSM 11195 / SNP6) TaxID=693661 RepID=F2KR50_ARCVS|nr:hypothetical protein [Archaeoglobus veneficus]AEA46687.1 hypothetical protein Arcve_0667 [Archaeoglobus veneficus SNP6]
MEQQVIRHEHFSFRPEPELKISVTRGQRGGYGWEITYTGKDMDEVLRVIKEADEKLRRTFLEGDA